MTRCNENNFKIFVYNRPNMIKSQIYKNILSSLKNSKYLTRNPKRACIFISSIDTLDRDRLSKNYIHDLDDLVTKLNYWNNGENHLIFNMYSGSWPDYKEDLEFKTEKAILVKASFSQMYYRKSFDISFPLFHADIPIKNSKFTNLTDLIYGPKKYFLTFKGKRYLHGVGSKTRDKLYHLNNNRDIILLTTCRHGDIWFNFKDDRCDLDDSMYDKYDYSDLLNNSIFCLIPRGRRLGTYRFLEALKVGCIPVLLSDSWVLPFSEVIDWNKAVVWGKESEITQLTSYLREIKEEDIIRMKKYSFYFYNKYFSSIDKIVNTTIHILIKRIRQFKILNDR
ncbi:unnamed protein product [Brachionus calyciflorus]|uniref:Exostosin GT47 domain-containing protein n=1 Tax=Brachionus calyciflorus TaxID=104777 RepID=A0A813Q758_9BILA|nr:unnamed protein product [Brachionus calyciflorus]